MITLHAESCQRLGSIEDESRLEVDWARAHSRASVEDSVFFRIINDFSIREPGEQGATEIARSSFQYVVVMTCGDPESAGAIASSAAWLSTAQRLVHPLVRSRLLTQMSEMNIALSPLPLVGPGSEDSQDLDLLETEDAEAIDHADGSDASEGFPEGRPRAD
ncbi:hypothetical protein BJF81_12040 [Ornithinimicrobium sp. CNJ-824]|uniref:hypothetical protein n=1 Tax=Ornithinimicrobium sp. CNJ-824 TaxID=1904966 RepID=UPI000969D4AE|nr:hypothetical protein [Ornithinimicrobium sp. CNJ-824]OLT22966.1 hypothetical protein BJF81_12040 [Ornithinimicrobium sp. CNJ-824]